jgi:hypothetical protein
VSILKTVASRTILTMRAAFDDSRVWQRWRIARDRRAVAGTLVLADSRAVKTADLLFSATAAGWQQSAARALLTSALRPIRGLELTDRVRLIGWMTLVAVVTHLLVTAAAAPFALRDLLEASRVARVLALSPMLGLLVLAAVMVAAPQPVARAWVDRTGWRGGDSTAPTVPIEGLPRHDLEAAPESPAPAVPAPAVRARTAVVMATGAALVVVFAIFSATQVTVRWTTAPETVAAGSASSVFVWTSRGGLLTLTADRPTRFEVGPAGQARILWVTNNNQTRRDVNGAAALTATDRRGNVSIGLMVDRAGPATLTATDVLSGVSRTVSFTAR